MAEITLPHNWHPRDYQMSIMNYMQNGGTRAVAVWHRRCGKDMMALNWTVMATQMQRGIYWHMLPTQAQGRKVIWNGVDNTGNRLLNAFPGFAEFDRKGTGSAGLIERIRDDEMRIELTNGSQWQVVGSDNYDSLIGSNPRGVIFSEYSVADPMAWDYLRPILRMNGGWAMFIYTPRGHNHGLKMLDNARQNKNWFAEVLTVDDTGLLTEEDIQEERDCGMSELMIKQEYFCSFDAPLQGAIYSDEMMKIAEEKRICHVPHETNVRVETYWDLGVTDSTAIWFAQRVGSEIHVIDYYESSDEPLAHYVNILENKREEYGYKYSRHVFPQDIKAKEFISGITREYALGELGIRPEIAPSHRLADGIEATRSMLKYCFFDMKRCDRGIQALRQYRRERMNKFEKEGDDEIPMYKERPVHDWTSHACDALRYGAVTQPRKKAKKLKYPKLPIV